MSNQANGAGDSDKTTSNEPNPIRKVWHWVVALLGNMLNGIRKVWRWVVALLGNMLNRIRKEWLWVAAIALLVAYGGFLVFLREIGAFKFPAEEPAAEVLVAVVGVLGGAFAAILTFFGVLLKHSVDERNLVWTASKELMGDLALKINSRLLV